MRLDDEICRDNRVIDYLSDAPSLVTSLRPCVFFCVLEISVLLTTGDIFDNHAGTPLGQNANQIMQHFYYQFLYRVS
jgi:hypothetical protein